MKRLFLVFCLLVPFTTAQEQGRLPRREGQQSAELQERLQVARQRLDQLRQRLHERREGMREGARDPQQGRKPERPNQQGRDPQGPGQQRRSPERQQGTPPQRHDAGRGGAEMPRRFGHQGGGSFRPLLHEFLRHRMHRLEMLEQADQRGEPKERANPQGRKPAGATGKHRRGRGTEV